MKTTIALITLTASLTLSNGAFAQSRHAGHAKTAASQAHTTPSYYSNSHANSWSFGGDLVINKTFYSDDAGTGSGSMSIGMTAVADLILTPEYGLTGKLGYNNVKFSAVPITGITADISYDYITLCALFRYSINRQFSVAAGPTAAFVAGDGSATLSTTGSSKLKKATVTDLSGSHYGVEIEAAYDISVSRTVTLRPSASYDLMLIDGSSDLQGEISGHANMMHINLGLRFGM